MVPLLIILTLVIILMKRICHRIFTCLFLRLKPHQAGKQFWLVVILFVGALHGTGTVLGQSHQFNTVIPPSPRSQEFEKFINYKVSLHNGLPDINVNFYTIELDGVKIPIGLSYHASGIKFKQTSGDVGLGWALSPGFRVSRTVHGRADESAAMPDMNNFPDGYTIGGYLNNAFTSAYDRDRYLARYLNVRPGGDIPAVMAADPLDGEYDVFTIGLPEQSGTFIITNRQQQVGTVLDNAALPDINYTLSDGIINSFSLTDRNGVHYKLGQNDLNNENLQIYVDGVYKKYSSAWLLSEITTLFNNKIAFQYQQITESSEGMPTFNRTLIEGVSGEYCNKPMGGALCYQTSDNKGQEQQGTTTNYQTQILTSIATPKEQVSITRNTNGTVNSILITGKNGAQIKNVSFFYSQSGSTSFLDSVVIAGSDNIAVERYGFEYTTKELNFSNYDGFGYMINDQGGEFRYAVQLNDSVSYMQQGYNPYDNVTDPDGNPVTGCVNYTKLQYTIFRGSDKKSASISDAGMLRRITYPTGGTQQFVFEPNQYEGTYPYPAIRHGGGFRVSSITSNDAVKGTAITRNYFYGKGNRSIDPADPRYYLGENIVLGVFSCPSLMKVVSLRKTTQSSVLAEPLAESLEQPSSGWYSEVTEDYGEGKIVYKFNVLDQTPEVSTYPTNQNYVYRNVTVTPRFSLYYVKAYKYWNKPCLVEKTVYKRTGASSYARIQQEDYEYFPIVISPVSEEFTGFKITPFALGNEIGAQTSTTPIYDLYTHSGISSVFLYATYTLTKASPLVKRKVMTDVDIVSGVELVTTSDYTYTTADLIATEKITSSRGDVLQANYKYASNYTGVNTGDNISAGIKKLQLAGVTNALVEKSTYRMSLNGADKRLVASEFYAYKPDLPVWDGVFRTELPAPSTAFSESYVDNGSIVKDNSYKEYLKYDQYDSRGNILQRTKTGDVSETYIWGYDTKYPVAKIVGSNYATAAQIVDHVKLNNGASYTDAEIRAELNKIRTNLPGAMVYTYTYLPLTGVSSETDPSGRLTAYEYDSFGRLKLIRGNDNNVIRQFDYQYRSATSSSYFLNTAQSRLVTRNNCQIGVGGSVTYSVPAGRYSSTVSQAAADLLAQQDLDQNGQAYANIYGSCITFYNAAKSQGFLKANCTGDQTGTMVVYDVPAGKYSSNISQADADQKAIDEINLNGQNYANINGDCLPPVYAKLRYENMVQAETTTTADVVVRFYSNSACTVPVTVTEGIYIQLKITKTKTPENEVTETFETFNCTGASTLLKSNAILSERTSPAPGAPATNYAFSLQNGYGYIVR